MLRDVYEESHNLFEKAHTDDFDERDLYVVMEVMQRYIDILDEFIESDLSINTHPQPQESEFNVKVEVDGQTIQFQDIEDVASWLRP